MIVALRNPIAAKVEDRFSFLRMLLDEYPKLLRDWEEKTDKMFMQEAQEFSGGDLEIELSYLSSMRSAFDVDGDKEDMFYQAIFLMCYSYYESCIALLSKNANAKETIGAICNTKNITMSDESLKAIDYLQNDINDLRNNLCHNNFGTYRKVDVLKKLSDQNLGLKYEDDTLSFTGDDLIRDALEKMHIVLHELCEKLGCKTRIIHT